MQIQLKKILVGFEVGSLAEATLRHAAELGRQFSAEVILLHAVEPPGYLALIPPGTEGYIAPPSEAAQEAYARQEADRLMHGLGMKARMIVRTGKPFVEIIRAAREEEADLIVVGTHGRTVLAQMLMGSTAEKVVQKAPCPVLTVREGQHEFVAP